MRALFLSDVAAPRVNGVSTSIDVFRRELAALGVATPLVAPRYSAEAAEPGVTRLPGRVIPFDREDRFVRPRRFAAAARREVFDLIHVHTPFAAHAAGVRVARELGVPLVETWHTDFENYFEHYVPLLPRFAARACARYLAVRIGRAVDHLVVPSCEMAEVLAGYGIGTPRTVIATGIATDDLGGGDGGRFRARHGIPVDRPVVVHVGRVAHEKNLAFLLRAVALAWREVPEILLVVAGEGPAKASLQQLAMDLGLAGRTLWLGYLDRRTELADVYLAADLFAFSSRTETQGLVLLEAMSLGVPVVALAERGTRDLLACERGALVPRASEPEFAAALVRLLNDQGLRRRLGAEARELARSWSAAGSAATLAQLYRELLSRHAARSPI